MKFHALLALAGALAAGVVMSFGQTLALPGLAPLFNSAAPVVALAAAVALAARSWWAHALLAAAAGPLAMVGYYGTSSLRGYGVSSSMVLMWCTAGVVAGVVMGLAVWLLRDNAPGVRFIGPMRALGAAVFPAVALGEAAHGVVRIADTTPVAYWWSLGAVGVGVLVWLAVTRLRSAGLMVLAAVAAIAGGSVIFWIFDAGIRF